MHNNFTRSEVKEKMMPFKKYDYRSSFFKACLPLFLFTFLAAGCSPKFTETGNASYYSDNLRGNKMANGDKYRPYKKTAAHKTLPFGTKVKVTNVKTGESVKVKITDRGPYTKGRIIDLSRSAAKKINMTEAGVVPVKIKVIKPVKPQGKK